MVKQLKKMMAPTKLLLFLVTCLPLLASAQMQDTLQTKSINNKRLRILTIGSGIAYSTTIVGLSELWYKNSDRQAFHFFNDNSEWKQMDKFGHFYSAFYAGYGTSSALQWCGIKQRKSVFIGALTGFLIMMPIEILDGFTNTYGASGGDLLANAAGSSFFLIQSLLWDDVRIYPKFSFHRTGYAPLRPNELGDNLPSEILKDYNGQTYWLSFDMDKFTHFPKWLNLAVGYGAQGMVYARDNQNNLNNYDPYRQYYLSIDFDLSAIKTKSKAIKRLLSIASMIKIPAPAIELSRKGMQFHAFYF